MNKLFRTLLASLAVTAAFASAPSLASPAAPQKDTDYKVLATPQPVDSSAGKIEVTEFFWYGCPHCNEFEPYLETWLKKQGPDVVFKRVPVAFQPQFVPHQKLYHAVVELASSRNSRRRSSTRSTSRRTTCSRPTRRLPSSRRTASTSRSSRRV